MATMKSKYNSAQINFWEGKNNLVIIEVELDYILNHPTLLTELRVYLRGQDSNHLLDLDYTHIEDPAQFKTAVRFQINVLDLDTKKLERIAYDVLNLVEEAAL